MSEDKGRAKDSCWSIRMIYGPRGLLGVSIAGPRMDRVLHICTYE
jgi:hypothetical protein